MRGEFYFATFCGSLLYQANTAETKHSVVFSVPGGGGGGVLPLMAYTGRLRPKGAPFSRFRYMTG